MKSRARATADRETAVPGVSTRQDGSGLFHPACHAHRAAAGEHRRARQRRGSPPGPDEHPSIGLIEANRPTTHPMTCEASGARSLVHNTVTSVWPRVDKAKLQSQAGQAGKSSVVGNSTSCRSESLCTVPVTSVWPACVVRRESQRAGIEWYGEISTASSVRCAQICGQALAHLWITRASARLGGHLPKWVSWLQFLIPPLFPLTPHFSPPLIHGWFAALVHSGCGQASASSCGYNLQTKAWKGCGLYAKNGQRYSLTSVAARLR